MTEKIPFRKYGDITTGEQTFDKDKIFITKFGQKINVYDMIQENNVDTDIYKIMQKYGYSEEQAKSIMAKGKEGIYADLTGINGLRDLEEKSIKAKELWESLPIEERRKYDHNINKFLQNGEETILNEIKTKKEQDEKIKAELEAKATEENKPKEEKK